MMPWQNCINLWSQYQVSLCLITQPAIDLSPFKCLNNVNGQCKEATQFDLSVRLFSLDVIGMHYNRFDAEGKEMAQLELTMLLHLSIFSAVGEAQELSIIC
ncbi:uncharacterized [Tachysurus ichikawai]